MTNQETYFKCAYCGQQYTNEQFQSLQSSFSLLDYDQEVVEITCGHCKKVNTAIRAVGNDDPLIVAEKIEPSIFDDDTPEYDFDDIIPDDYMEIEDHQYVLPVQPPPQKPQKFRLTDVGNAKRLVSLLVKTFDTVVVDGITGIVGTGRKMLMVC